MVFLIVPSLFELFSRILEVLQFFENFSFHVLDSFHFTGISPFFYILGIPFLDVAEFPPPPPPPLFNHWNSFFGIYYGFFIAGIPFFLRRLLLYLEFSLHTISLRTFGSP